MVESRTILNSKRFEDVLKKHKVHLWLSAHTHVPSFMGMNESTVRYLNNITFVNVARIRRDMKCNPESRVIILKQGSSKMIIKTRDHHTGKYVKRREMVINLKKNFVFENSKPIFLLPKSTE